MTIFALVISLMSLAVAFLSWRESRKSRVSNQLLNEPHLNPRFSIEKEHSKNYYRIRLINSGKTAAVIDKVEIFWKVNGELTDVYPSSFKKADYFLALIFHEKITENYLVRRLMEGDAIRGEDQHTLIQLEITRDLEEFKEKSLVWLKSFYVRVKYHGLAGDYHECEHYAISK